MAPFLHRLLATLCILLFVLPALAVNASADITEFHEGRVLTTYNLSADDLADRVVSFRLSRSRDYPSLLGNSANKQTRIDSASRCGAEYDLPNQDKSTISSVYGSWIVPELIQRSEGVPDNPPLNWQWIVEWVGMDNVGTDGQSDHDCSLLEVGVLSLVSRD